MGRLTRRLDRKLNRRADRELGAMPFEGRLLILAGDSLGLTAQQISDVANTFAKVEQLRGEQLAAAPDAELAQIAAEIEQADMVIARVTEMLELMKQRRTVPAALLEAAETVQVGREEVERRQGAGFCARVAAMGKPALAALVAAGLALVLFLCPSVAKAAQVERVFALGNAHKIQRRNFAGLLPKRRKFRQNLAFWGWIRSKKSYATSPRRLRSSLLSATGCAVERVSSRRLARPSRSSWCGASAAFALGGCPPLNPTSRLNVPAARSSARRGASQAKGAANANA